MNENTRPLIEVLIEMGKAREAILARMKAALQDKDIETVAASAAQLCGFEEKEVQEYAALARNQGRAIK